MRILLLSLFYGFAYLALWFNSLDQWYLPAGLRVSALLLCRTRYWPALFVSEFCAILLLNFPFTFEKGYSWTIISSCTTFPIVALVIYFARKHSALPFANNTNDLTVFIYAAIGAAVAATFSNKLTSLLLGHSTLDQLSASQLVLYFLGDYLGILVLGTIPLLWEKRQLVLKAAKPLGLDTLKCLPAFLVLAIVPHIGQTPYSDVPMFHLACMLLVFPSIWLTMRHGWVGACLGTTIANLSIATTTHHPDVMGARDEAVMLIQEALAIISTALIGLGSMISHHYLNSRRNDRRFAEALNLAREGFSYSERHLRVLRERAKNTTRMLWAPRVVNGHITYIDSTPSSVLDSIYPSSLNEYGLFAALSSPNFSKSLGVESIKYRAHLVGPAYILKDDLQEAIYRTACDAVLHFSLMKPEKITLRIRVLTGVRSRAIAVIEGINPVFEIQNDEYLQIAKKRAKAYGALFHESSTRVGVLFYS